MDDRAISRSIARAFTYLKNQLPKLSIYVEDGGLNIDNNIDAYYRDRWGLLGAYDKSTNSKQEGESKKLTTIKR